MKQQKLKKIVKSPINYTFHNRNVQTEELIISCLSKLLAPFARKPKTEKKTENKTIEEKTTKKTCNVKLGINATIRFLASYKSDHKVYVFVNNEDFGFNHALISIPVRAAVINKEGDKIFVVNLSKGSEEKLCKTLNIPHLACLTIYENGNDSPEMEELRKLVEGYVGPCKVDFIK